MWLETRDGGHQGSYPGRDSDGDHQDVIDHQSGGGHEPGARAQIPAGDCVRSPAPRIRLDRLPVGEVDDGEENDDARADGDDVEHAGRAQGNEKGQSRLRPVRGGAQGVQSEDWDPGGGTDLFRASFGRGETLAENEIENSHPAILHIPHAPAWFFRDSFDLSPDFFRVRGQS